ncbi:hypothetical protein CCHR01_04585 [Colletotrichum chrysophilum]|uniref:Uncharacterized protein n=1 Tax=Colletotrichum chrysophilum TaxID=1836956 RepID=A0AAD9EID5_9PEZI|nr:hypothetical protein CCHR01_04585 [Colletotrichum chrysophilum]
MCDSHEFTAATPHPSKCSSDCEAIVRVPNGQVRGGWESEHGVLNMFQKERSSRQPHPPPTGPHSFPRNCKETSEIYPMIFPPPGFLPAAASH